MKERDNRDLNLKVVQLLLLLSRDPVNSGYYDTSNLMTSNYENFFAKWEKKKAEAALKEQKLLDEIEAELWTNPVLMEIESDIQKELNACQSDAEMEPLEEMKE